MKKKVRGPSESWQQTEARILRAAEKVFAAKGFSGTSMDALANEAKLSKQNLIYYFSSKEVLYRGVLQNAINLWMERLSLIETPGATPREVMRTYLWQKIELSRNFPDASKVFAHEIINGAPMLEDYLLSRIKPQFERDVGVVNSWVKKGLVKPVSAEHLFLLFGHPLKPMQISRLKLNCYWISRHSKIPILNRLLSFYITAC